jgi:hypothetical protein
MGSVRSPQARLAALVLTIGFALTAAQAGAVTVDQVVALSKAGVSEAVILALLERDGNILTIEPEQLLALKRDGLSDALVTAMLRNGRDSAADAARAVSDANAASILASLSSAPDVLIVGHGPERPDTIHTEDHYAGLRDGVVLPSSRRGPFGYGYGGYRAHRYQPPVFQPPVFEPPIGRLRSGYSEPMLCIAQVNTAVGRGPAYVTECPAVMQRQPGTR